MIKIGKDARRVLQLVDAGDFENRSPGDWQGGEPGKEK